MAGFLRSRPGLAHTREGIRLSQSMKKTFASSSKVYLFLLLMVILGPLGNVLLGKGMRQVGSISSWDSAEVIHFLSQVAGSVAIWLGILCLMVFFAVYMLVLSWADYSYVQPASAVAYGMVALLGHFLLGEAITPMRWTGVLIICLGVLVVGNTPPRTTESRG